MIDFFIEAKSLKDSTNQVTKNKDIKLLKYIKAGALAGGLGFTAKAVYNTYTRLTHIVPLFQYLITADFKGDKSQLFGLINKVDKLSNYKVNIDEMFNSMANDNMSTFIEKMYYSAKDKTPEGIGFTINKFFTSIGWSTTGSNNFITRLSEKITMSILNINDIKGVTDERLSKIVPITASISVAIIGLIAIAVIIGTYYILKFLYKKYKSWRQKKLSNKN